MLIKLRWWTVVATPQPLGSAPSSSVAWCPSMTSPASALSAEQTRETTWTSCQTTGNKNQSTMTEDQSKYYQWLTFSVCMQVLLIRGPSGLLPDPVSGPAGLPVPQHRPAWAAPRPRLPPWTVSLRQGWLHPHPVREHPARSAPSQVFGL